EISGLVMDKKITAGSASKDGLQALICNDVEQLEGRTGRASLALLPFAHRRSCGVKVEREHRLAKFQGFAQAFDVCCTELPHRWRADRVELAHCHLADRAHFVERSQVATQRFNDLAHNAPPLKHPTATPSTRLQQTVPRTPCRRIAAP